MEGIGLAQIDALHGLEIGGLLQREARCGGQTSPLGEPLGLEEWAHRRAVGQDALRRGGPQLVTIDLGSSCNGTDFSRIVKQK